MQTTPSLTHYSHLFFPTYLPSCSDIVPVVGKNHVPYKRSTDWVKSFLSMADRLEQDSWGDNRHDADGNKKESAAAYAKNLIPQL